MLSTSARQSPRQSQRYRSRFRFPEVGGSIESDTTLSKGSETFPSTVMDTRFPFDLATTKTSLLEGLLPPGNGVSYSGNASNISMVLNTSN